MTNRFRALIGFVTTLVTGEIVAYVPGWQPEVEFTIPRDLIPDNVFDASQAFVESERGKEKPQPFRCYVTCDLSANTEEDLIQSMSNWEL